MHHPRYLKGMVMILFPLARDSRSFYLDYIILYLFNLVRGNFNCIAIKSFARKDIFKLYTCTGKFISVVVRTGILRKAMARLAAVSIVTVILRFGRIALCNKGILEFVNIYKYKSGIYKWER